VLLCIWRRGIWGQRSPRGSATGFRSSMTRNSILGDSRGLRLGKKRRICRFLCVAFVFAHCFPRTDKNEEKIWRAAAVVKARWAIGHVIWATGHVPCIERMPKLKYWQSSTTRISFVRDSDDVGGRHIISCLSGRTFSRTRGENGKARLIVLNLSGILACACVRFFFHGLYLRPRQSRRYPLESPVVLKVNK